MMVQITLDRGKTAQRDTTENTQLSCPDKTNAPHDSTNLVCRLSYWQMINFANLMCRVLLYQSVQVYAFWEMNDQRMSLGWRLFEMRRG